MVLYQRLCYLQSQYCEVPVLAQVHKSPRTGTALHSLTARHEPVMEVGTLSLGIMLGDLLGQRKAVLGAPISVALCVLMERHEVQTTI